MVDHREDARSVNALGGTMFKTKIELTSKRQ
jgi:hypothetical protein